MIFDISNNRFYLLSIWIVALSIIMITLAGDDSISDVISSINAFDDDEIYDTVDSRYNTIEVRTNR